MGKITILEEMGLSFDDVLLVPQYSEILADSVCLKTRLTKNIFMNIPLMSAAMDTVTEARLAIALAREGGIGVIHKNCSIEEQSLQVKFVKRAQNAMIVDPIVLFDTDTIGEAISLRKQHEHVSGIPIITKERTLVGIVTTSDIRFYDKAKYVSRLQDSVTTIMTPDPYCISLEQVVNDAEIVDLQKAEALFMQYKTKKLLVVDNQKHLVGMITSKDVENLDIYPNACIDSKFQLRVAAAIGPGDNAMKRALSLINAGVDALVIDTAHGHSKGVIELLKQCKADFPNVDVIVGNIATKEAAKALCEAGADAVKIGIGPGSICTTRIVTGVGVPQLTAVMNVSQFVKEHYPHVTVIADGGIKNSGDIPKALAAGADSVMIGSLFAGTKEAPGEVIKRNGKEFKSYRGMGSIEAMKKGSKDRYNQANVNDSKKLVPEGVEATVIFKGDLCDNIYMLMGGVRSSMGYNGAQDIPALQDHPIFIRITNAGLKESHVHDVTIDKEAPNYHS